MSDESILDTKLWELLKKTQNIVYLLLLPIMLAIFIISSPRGVRYVVYISIFLFSYLGIIDEIEEFRNFKRIFKLKKLENKVYDDIKDNLHIFIFFIIGILSFTLYYTLKTSNLDFKYLIIPLFLIIFIFLFSKILPFFHFSLRKKVELYAYVSFAEIMIITVFINSLYFIVRYLYPFLSLESFMYGNLTGVSLMFVGILFISIINIQINTWRINRRFSHIIDLKTKKLKIEKNKINKATKDISDIALKKSDYEELWRRNEILKTRLSCIEKEINKISNEYISKPHYLSKIPILIAVIYGVFEIFVKILELFGYFIVQ